MLESPKEILRKYWGYSEFKGSQQKIIEAVLNRQDVLALLPTGGGKSLCFQIPAMAKEGICIVISPLIALIQNQVDSLRQRNIKAIALTGGIPFNELNNLLDNCVYGNYKFLYLSPERLHQEIVQERIQQMNVNLIAIDEAHCISQWGHDFRPAYLECSKLRELAPDAPIIALTATATEQVAKDIVSNLQFNNPLVFKDSFSRPNIAFAVIWSEDKHYRLKILCSKARSSVILYVRTRRLTQELANYLNQNHCSADYFHGGIDKKDKEKKLNAWLHNKVQIMVATNAFGMGIDKADVSLVIHYQVPDCIENYFQEAGRAGRNGEPAMAVLLTNKADESQVRNQYLSVLPDVPYLKEIYKRLNNYFQISYGEGYDEMYQLNFNNFCETYSLKILMTYNALRILDQNSVISLSESFSKRTTVRFVTTKDQLFSYLEKHKAIAPAIQTILRTYGGIFDYDTKINTSLLSKKAAMPEEKVQIVLKQLQDDNIIEYVAQQNDLSITFLVPREDDRTINVFAHKIKQQQQLKADKVEDMLAYTKNDNICRSKQLLTYFGENKETDCGICDVCVNRLKQENVTSKSISDDILALLEAKNQTSRELIAVLNHPEHAVLDVIKQLLANGIIKINTRNEYERYRA
ncbi:RecQ family ATP-dependent DNA helicase [Kriegella aquimaris]|uniref:ATP-dependent DNA helicase RecQ n=1 Tax=Kriegella aquimaris TaxID=192904 RepID=A0A1G9J9Y6_9FLAO|nr:RecQ family ATP-dependent DNA helicase [Kriegella aquimaris]SDL34016.1 ATP-dependent DNA helicase RecQ [Kriegella aquimaris]